MSRIIVLVGSLIAVTLLGFGCADQNSSSAPPGAVHPADWGRIHATQAQDLRGCQGCHGLDFAGGSANVSCFVCHASGPPFLIHPESWVDVVVAHQDFARTLSWTTCAIAACHGSSLAGGQAGPSCFNLSVSCHSSTQGDPPAPASHAVVPFTSPLNHGALAKTDQIYCQNCHGRPPTTFDGGFISDPVILNNLRFDGTPVNGNCSVCHPVAMAHPQDWDGPGPITHRGNNTPACALCHNTASAGPGPVPAAPSCFVASHADGASNVAVACHGDQGVGAFIHPRGAAWLLASAHGASSNSDRAGCLVCHDMATGGTLPTPACRSCHTEADPPLALGVCTSCHGNGPNGTIFPNRLRRHGTHNGVIGCSGCHSSFGSGSLQHWLPDPTLPANVLIPTSAYRGTDPAGQRIVFTPGTSSSNATCTGVCHGENHTNFNW